MLNYNQRRGHVWWPGPVIPHLTTQRWDYQEFKSSDRANASSRGHAPYKKQDYLTISKEDRNPRVTYEQGKLSYSEPGGASSLSPTV